MNTATIEIVKRIPKPPHGWQYEDRQPKVGESFILLDDDAWLDESVFSTTTNTSKDWSYAYRIPKKKRLMTPQELAGKWLHCKDSHILVTAYQQDSVSAKLTGDKAERYQYKVKDLVAMGATWSDTPTSEPRSIEVEE